MKTLKFDDTIPAPLGAIREIAFYDTIHDLPMFRLNEFQIHLCQDSGIGSSLADFDTRLGGVYNHLSADDSRTATQELLNARMGLMFMLESISTKARCLADLVFSIDGEPLRDFSNDALLIVHQRIMERMSSAQAQELIDDLKKKFKRELKNAFPTLFPDDEEMQFYANIIRRAILKLEDWEKDSDDEHPDIKQIDDWLREQTMPRQFDATNPESIIEDMRRNFEQVCSGLALYNVYDAEYLTAYKFHSRILFIKTNKTKPQSHDTLSNDL
jgi:hypothetical protein